jgi:hypothetical protein
VVRPTAKVLELFDNAVGPMLELSIAVQNQMAVVSATRDFLLPKLVNGALNIESLGIDDWFGGTHLAGTRVRSAPDHYVSISVGCCSAGSVAVPYTASKMPCAK